MSILRVNTLQDVAGSGQPAMSGAAKAWVTFNGSGTVAINASFNVSSIGDNGVGIYTVNTQLADADYAVIGIADRPGTTGNCILSPDASTVTKTSTQMRIRVTNSADGATDSNVVCVAFFR